MWACLQGLDLTDREKIFFVGWLQARTDAVDLELSPKTERRYRAVLASLSSNTATNIGTRIRLNYETGCEEAA